MSSDSNEIPCNNLMAPGTLGDSPKAPIEQGIKKHDTDDQSAAARRTPNKAAPKPQPKSRKVKKYCQQCESKRALGGHKIHNCGSCEYYGEREVGPVGRAPSQSATQSNASPTRSDKIYCDECTERKNSPVDNGRSRKNAKHKCAGCLRLRDEMSSSRAGAKPRPRLPSGSQAVKETSETSTNNPEPRSTCKRKHAGGDETQRRVREHPDSKNAHDMVSWIQATAPYSQCRDDGEESGVETEEDSPYKYRSRNGGGLDTTAIRPRESPKMLAPRVSRPAAWVSLDGQSSHTNGGEGGSEDRQQVSDRDGSAFSMPEIVPDCTQLPTSTLGAEFQPWASDVFLSSENTATPPVDEDLPSYAGGICYESLEDGSWLPLMISLDKELE